MHRVRKHGSRQKILIVEDRVDTQYLFHEFLAPHLKVIAAYTIAGGRILFDSHGPSLIAVVVDARFKEDSGYRPLEETMDFVRHVRTHFHGPILAAAADTEDQQELMKAGCTVLCKEKRFMPSTLMELLDIKRRHRRHHGHSERP